MQSTFKIIQSNLAHIQKGERVREVGRGEFNVWLEIYAQFSHVHIIIIFGVINIKYIVAMYV